MPVGKLWPGEHIKLTPYGTPTTGMLHKGGTLVRRTHKADTIWYSNYWYASQGGNLLGTLESVKPTYPCYVLFRKMHLFVFLCKEAIIRAAKLCIPMAKYYIFKN